VIINYGASPSGGKWEDTYEIPDSEWNEMTTEEQEELLSDLASEALAYSCDSWAYAVED
jgi:hypothetical protein